MNILLVAINAKYIHSNLAVYNLKACSGKYEDNITIAEYTINEYPEVILREIYNHHPDLVAVSCYIWNITFVEEVFKDFNRICPDIPIWVGGPEVSYESVRFLEEHPYITGVMRGEGEETFAELLNCYYDNEIKLSDLSGITYRDKDGTIHDNGMRNLVNMDSIPFVYENISDFKNKIIYYESSRGCPFSCSYCLSSIDKKVRFRSMDKVKKELLFFINNDVPQVKFVDRTFNCDRLRARQIWQFLIDNDKGITNFHFEVGADLLQEEDFEIFKNMRRGLIQLEIGVQSTNDKTLSEIRRTMDLDKLRDSVAHVLEHENIHQHLDLIAGLPYENFDSFRKSFKDVFEMKPNQLQLGFLKVLKGSYMYEMAEEYNIKYSAFPPYEVFSTKWISYDEIIRLKGIEDMVEVYYNSDQFSYTLKELLNKYDNPFDLFDELASFYKRKSYNRMSHSRMARYDILREFVEYRFPDILSDITELLIIDLYARDNLKNRPLWAPDISKYKDEVYDFFREEEKERRYLKGYEQYNFKQMLKMTHMEIVDRQNGDRKVYLFDYINRNPINKEAEIIQINID